MGAFYDYVKSVQVEKVIYNHWTVMRSVGTIQCSTTTYMLICV